jgi:hypothetical protein
MRFGSPEGTQLGPLGPIEILAGMAIECQSRRHVWRTDRLILCQRCVKYGRALEHQTLGRVHHAIDNRSVE